MEHSNRSIIIGILLPMNIEKMIFLAQVLCGAEFALAEMKRQGTSDSHLDGREKRARIVTEILHQVFEEQNYQIQVRGFNQEIFM